jgi:hypothetical protein
MLLYTYMSVYTHTHRPYMVPQISVTTRLIVFPLLGVVDIGRAIAQAVSPRLLRAAARVRAQVSSCGIFGKQAQGQVCSEYFSFPCQFSFHRLLHFHHPLSSGVGTEGQTAAAVSSGHSLTPLQETKTNYAL